MFRLLCTLSIAIGLFNCGTVADCCGQIMITQLPEDGTWARYEMVAKQDLSAQDDESGQEDKSEQDNEDAPIKEIKIKGEVTIRSVGSEQVQNETHRWIEIEHRIAPQRELSLMGEHVNITKLLLSENGIRNGKPFAENAKRIIVYENSSDGETTDEFDPGSALGKNALRQFNLYARFKSKPLPVKDIKTGVGSFKCDVTNYSGFEAMPGQPAGNARQDVDDKQAIPFKVQHISCDVFVNEKSPFGLVHSIYKSERVRDDKRQPFATVRFTLKETGTGAKSTIDHKKLSGKMP